MSVQFSGVRYFQLGAISAIYIEKAAITERLKIQTNVSIQIANTIDQVIIDAEILKY